MAVAFEIRVSDLLTEFLANALVFLGALQTTGTVSAGALQAFFDRSYHFFIFI